jgi:hypothetical protein
MHEAFKPNKIVHHKPTPKRHQHCCIQHLHLHASHALLFHFIRIFWRDCTPWRARECVATNSSAKFLKVNSPLFYFIFQHGAFDVQDHVQMHVAFTDRAQIVVSARSLQIGSQTHFDCSIYTISKISHTPFNRQVVYAQSMRKSDRSVVQAGEHSSPSLHPVSLAFAAWNPYIHHEVRRVPCR